LQNISITIVLLTILIVFAGCNRNTARPANAANPSPTPVKRLIKEGGWKIPGYAIAKEIISPRLLQSSGNESVKIYSSWLSTVRKNASPVTLRDYLSEQEINELNIVGKKLNVMTIVKYDNGVLPFCYVVKYRSTYAMEALHYYDEDGDKRFELVETGTASQEYIPRIPNWLKQ
jgi:hypothetical protein